MDEGEHKTRVLVTDDSRLAREVLSSLLGRDPDIEVVGLARDGIEAIRLVQELRPDIVLMDLHMPILDGIAATAEIMRRVPMPVVLVTSAKIWDRGDALVDALDHGVVDVIAKPARTTPGSPEAQSLVHKVKLLSRVDVRALDRPSIPRAAQTGRPRLASPPSRAEPVRAIGVGGSTGGPRAIHAILSQLPASFPTPILVSQHLSAGFTSGFARWLDSSVPLTVVEAQDGIQPSPGTVLLAPGGRTMVLEGPDVVRLRCEADVGEDPCIDALLRSLADVHGEHAGAVLLSGLGRHGTAGMGAVVRANGRTLVQSPDTCVVPAMPLAAMEAGHAKAVVPVHEIPAELLAWVGWPL
jgi:two-component system chemotaxis response regulator CheB